MPQRVPQMCLRVDPQELVRALDRLAPAGGQRRAGQGSSMISGEELPVFQCGGPDHRGNVPCNDVCSNSVSTKLIYLYGPVRARNERNYQFSETLVA